MYKKYDWSILDTEAVRTEFYVKSNFSKSNQFEFCITRIRLNHHQLESGFNFVFRVELKIDQVRIEP